MYALNLDSLFDMNLMVSHVCEAKQAAFTYKKSWVYSQHYPSAFAWPEMMHAFRKSHCDRVCFCVAESRHTDPCVEGEAGLQQ